MALSLEGQYVSVVVSVERHAILLCVDIQVVLGRELLLQLGRVLVVVGRRRVE